MRFRYQGWDQRGHLQQGHIKADTLEDAVEELEGDGLEAVYLEEDPFPTMEDPMPTPEPPPRPVAPPPPDRPERPLRRLPPYERVIFLGHLAHMIEAGIPIARALATLAEQAAHPRLAGALRLVCRQVDRGRPLSEAMAAAAPAFPDLEIGAVRAGEQSGTLPRALRLMLQHRERDLGIERKIQSSLVYPTVVLGSAFALVLFLAQYLVAGIAPFLEHAHVPLPLATRLVLGLVALGHRPLGLLLLAALAAAAVWGSVRGLRSPRGKLLAEDVLFRLPAVGPVLRNVETQRVCEGIAVLYGCGTPLYTALVQVAQLCAAQRTRAAVELAAAAMREGVPLARGLDQSRYFPREVIHMVAVGEESGRLTHMLERLAQYQEMQIQAGLDRFAAAVEPIAILGMGILVAAIIMIALAPLYQLISRMT